MENKVTFDVLRQMAFGETRTFLLPKSEPELSRAARSGRSLAYALQREERCSFSVITDFASATLTITKKRQPVH